MTTPDDLRNAGRAFLEQWRRYLEQHPDADATAVNRAMLAGEWPPDEEAQQVKRERLHEAAQIRRRVKVEERVAGSLDTLTPLQRRFVIEYLSQIGATSATQAYIDAGGTSKYPGQAAAQILNHPDVQEKISEFFHPEEMSAREVVARLSEQARAEYTDYIDENGRVDLARMKADGKMHLVKGTKDTRYGLVVEFYDAFSALVKVGEYHALFKNVQSGDPDRPLQTNVQVYIPNNGRDRNLQPDTDEGGDE